MALGTGSHPCLLFTGPVTLRFTCPLSPNKLKTKVGKDHKRDNMYNGKKKLSNLANSHFHKGSNIL